MMIKTLGLIFLLMPISLFAQNKEKRFFFQAGTTQGISFLNKEALSNTHKSTFNNTVGYAYSYNLGISILSKNKRRFSDIILGYKSNSNGFKGAIDPTSESGKSSRISYDRFNLLSLEYRYSRYIPTFKNQKTFFSGGVQFSYALNRKMNLRFDNSSTKIVTKAKNISDNFILNTSPTFIFSYGFEFDGSVFGCGKQHSSKNKQRLSFDISYDWYAFNLIKSPINAYFGMAINYKILF